MVVQQRCILGIVAGRSREFFGFFGDGLKVVNCRSTMWSHSFSTEQTLMHSMESDGFEAAQPTPISHPEILKPGEIQPGISAKEFGQRRKRLSHRLGDKGLAILNSSPTVYMAGVIPYPYRQNADFHYMTGIIQPGCLATINGRGEFIVFYPDEDDMRNTWTGPLLNKAAAVDFFDADEAVPMSRMKSHLSSAVKQSDRVFVNAGTSPGYETLLSTQWKSALEILSEYHDMKRIGSLKHIVDGLRWEKSEGEIKLMRTSAQIASKAMKSCMMETSVGNNEHTISALFEWECRKRGAQRMAYPPVVASGADSCIIHYSRNDKKLEENKLLLLDGGCEYYGYCSDVTRTWPTDGKLEGARREVYDAVYDIHQRLLAECKPGNTLRALHRRSIHLITEALKSFGVLSAVSVVDGYRRFYPHSVGHWLGLDTHDSSSVSHELPLRQGVTLTIEPGIYIPDRQEFGVYRGIGIRLEDDVLITKDGCEVLSAEAPLHPDAIADILG